MSAIKHRKKVQEREDQMTAAAGLLDLAAAAAVSNESLDIFSIPFENTSCTNLQKEERRGPVPASTQTLQSETQETSTQTIYNHHFLGAKIDNIILKNTLNKSKTSPRRESERFGHLSLTEIKDNNKKMKYFTGLTFVQFMALFNFLGDSVNNLKYWSARTPSKSAQKDKRMVAPIDQLFITLVRLRRGFGLDTLIHLLGISSGTISTIFGTWIQLLFNHFNELREEMFPDRHHFKRFMPKVFKTFKNIRCSIDCTEFFVQMPRDFGRQGSLYSTYKHHHTYKCLIGTAPNGAIVYVSDLFEGSISDKNIVEKSGFLNHLHPGDLILADRGFTIDDLLMPMQVSLNIPPFLGKRTSLTPRENLKTRKIAKARIDVERVIERIKKFQPISGIIPLSLSPILNQFVFVCSCLVNFQKPVVS